MINLSTDYSEENREKYLTFQNEYFSAVTLNEPLDDTDLIIIKRIDGAEVIEDNRIYGKYGETYLSNLSSGTKTVLNLRNMLKKHNECYIDITSCGDNAIEVLVDILKQYDNEVSINLLTCLNNYISYTPINIRVDNSYNAKCFADVR